jgi:flagellar motor switch protein FliG
VDGREKVATQLLALDPKQAADLLSRFGPDEMADIVELMLEMEFVDHDTVRGVLMEFGQLVSEERDEVAEPRARVRSILEGALEEEQVENYLGEHDRAVLRSNPFAALARLEPAPLAELLADEHPQTIAIVLSRIQATKAGQALAQLPEGLAIEVVERMVNCETSAPEEVLESVGRALGQRAQALAGSAQPWATRQGRLQLVANMLSATSRSARDAAMGSVRERDPEVGEQVRELMFLFEDLPLLGAEPMRKVVGALDTQIVALALKTASDEVKQAVFNSISQRAAQTIREEQELLGPRPLSEVENAQQAFVDTVTRLQEEGEITIERGGNDEELV